MWPNRLGLTLYRLNRAMVAQAILRWALPCTPEAAFAFIAEQSAQFLSQTGMTAADLYGVSFSTAGILDYDNLILKFSAQSPNWGYNIPIGDFLRDTFGDKPRYIVENNGKFVGRAVGMSCRENPGRALVLFTSWGLSACLIHNGQILNGAHSVMGEVGHMVISPDEPKRCSCGSRGCAEQFLSLSRLIQSVMENPPPPESPLFQFPPERITFDILFAASSQGDDYARGHVRTLADRFALLLRNVSVAFDPEIVVFTGPFAGADAYFDACLKERLGTFRYYLSRCPFEIRYDKRDLLTLDAEGGAVAMMEHFISQPTLYLENG